MKTKAQIVQELLDEKKITAEEAVVLLMGDNQIIFTHHHIQFPSPIAPQYWQSPFVNVSNLN